MDFFKMLIGYIFITRLVSMKKRYWVLMAMCLGLLYGNAPKSAAKSTDAPPSVEQKPQVQLPQISPQPTDANKAKVNEVSPSTVPSSGGIVQNYDPKQFWGQPFYGSDGKLQYVTENIRQAHSKEQYVIVKVRNVKKDVRARNIGRIRVAVWDDESRYAKEGIPPFRAVSYWAKAVENDEMTFKIGGLTPGQKYSFFAHFDEANTGKIRRNFLGIPTDQYIFSSIKTPGGIKREGLKAPQFKNTLVEYKMPGQLIELSF